MYGIPSSRQPSFLRPLLIQPAAPKTILEEPVRVGMVPVPEGPPPGFPMDDMMSVSMEPEQKSSPVHLVLAGGVLGGLVYFGRRNMSDSAAPEAAVAALVGAVVYNYFYK